MVKNDIDISDFLKKEEIYVLTGFKKTKKQIRFLAEKGIKYYTTGGARSKLKILRIDAKAFLE